MGKLKGVVTTLILSLALGASPASSQWAGVVRVEETAGIQRNAYPARLRMEVPEGRLGYVSQLRLMDGATEVASQGTALSAWGDGSIRELELDFNLSIGPFEERNLELRYGAGIESVVTAGRGLVPMEDERSIAIGRVRLSRRGAPMLSSVAYREEVIGAGRNGIALVERSGIRRDAREITWEPPQMLKSGPLAVHVRYRGRLAMSGGSRADIQLDVEMPNSKSWIAISTTISDPDGKVGTISIETPLRLGAYPWTWDFSTPNATYGAFRDPTGSAVFTRAFDDTGASTWSVLAGSAGAETAYETGRPGSNAVSETWAHLVGPGEAVAFAAEAGPGMAGEFTIWLTGTGQASVGFKSAEPATEHAFTVYQHFVSTPVPIGAATSPASMLNPLRVTVE